MTLRKAFDTGVVTPDVLAHVFGVVDADEATKKAFEEERLVAHHRKIYILFLTVSVLSAISFLFMVWGRLPIHDLPAVAPLLLVAVAFGFGFAGLVAHSNLKVARSSQAYRKICQAIECGEWLCTQFLPTLRSPDALRRDIIAYMELEAGRVKTLEATMDSSTSGYETVTIAGIARRERRAKLRECFDKARSVGILPTDMRMDEIYDRAARASLEAGV